jgi:hypothetical protein
MERPQHFSQEVYEEVRGIIRKNKERMAPEAELALAHIAGGPQLRAAIHLLEFPPCPEGGECVKCWVCRWCVHTKTPVDIRMALINALGTFTTPDLKMPKAVIEKIKTYDKTNPNEVGVILEIARHYHAKQEKTKAQEKPKDDQPKSS